jgi:phage I-like protein
MKNRIALSIEILADAQGEPPKEFRLFKGGFVETTKGTFKFDERSCASVMSKAADWGNDFPVDYDHASLMSMWSADPAEAGKAAGWFKPEVRGGDLWATSVTWTPKAASMLKAREYRYCSPAFDTDDDGTITELVNCAITNLPATKRMDPLMASRAGEPGIPPKEKTMKVLLSKLGLSENASEAEAIAKLEALQSFNGQVFALTGKTSIPEAIGVLNAWRGNEAEVTRLNKALTDVEGRNADREIEDAIAKGKTDGKITPASEPELRKLAKEHGVKALTAFLSVAAAAPKPAEEPGKGGDGTLTPAELDACKKFGRKPEDFVALKKQAIANGTWPFAH